MIAEVATALHKLPSEAATITLSECESLYVYWLECPHTARALAMQLAATTTWKPEAPEAPFRETTLEEMKRLASETGLQVKSARDLH